MADEYLQVACDECFKIVPGNQIKKVRKSERTGSSFTPYLGKYDKGVMFTGHYNKFTLNLCEDCASKYKSMGCLKPLVIFATVWFILYLISTGTHSTDTPSADNELSSEISTADNEVEIDSPSIANSDPVSVENEDTESFEETEVSNEGIDEDMPSETDQGNFSENAPANPELQESDNN